MPTFKIETDEIESGEISGLDAAIEAVENLESATLALVVANEHSGDEKLDRLLAQNDEILHKINYVHERTFEGARLAELAAADAARDAARDVELLRSLEDDIISEKSEKIEEIAEIVPDTIIIKSPTSKSRRWI